MDNEMRWVCIVTMWLALINTVAIVLILVWLVNLNRTFIGIGF